MSVELLREAAKVLREHAEAATRGPWEAGSVWGRAGVFPEGLPPNIAPGCCACCDHWWPVVHVELDMDINGERRLGHVHRNPDPWGMESHISGADFDGVMWSGEITAANHAYVLLMHPPVALALAEWLDAMAALYDQTTGISYAEQRVDRAALATARAILRRSE